jgi:hypothetical protein
MAASADVSTWPEGWVPVVCQCGDVIGGYNKERPTVDLLEIRHGCGQVTVVYPSGRPPF